MSCFVAVWAAFELFVFGSRHDFLISDFLPFSQSCLSNQFLMWKMAVSYSYFLLAILDLGILLRLGHGRGICIVDAFI